MTVNAAAPQLQNYLPAALSMSTPDVVGPLAVFPLIGTPVEQPFLSFAEGSAHGVVIRELPQASVNDLLVVNPLDVPILLFEGEEVTGAQQDRTFDVTVLVPAHTTLQVPVSCVEHGRWDGSRHGEAFSPSCDAAFPSLRALKNQRMRGAMSAGLEARADQGEVWEEVDRKHAALGTASGTGAMGDIYAGRGDRLAELESAVSRRDGQIGAIVCIAGKPAVIDLVGRPDVFAALWQPLLRGYCLDAIEHDGQLAAFDAPDGFAFLDSVSSAHPQRHPGVGMGETIAFTRPGVGGAGLLVGEQLLQLSAFAEHGETVRAGRVLRPSRRG